MKRKIILLLTALALALSACQPDKVIPELESFLGFWYYSGDTPLKFERLNRKELLVTSPGYEDLDDFLDHDLTYEIDSLFLTLRNNNIIESDTAYDAYWRASFGDSTFWQRKFSTVWEINEDGQSIVVTRNRWYSYDYEPYTLSTSIRVLTRTPE